MPRFPVEFFAFLRTHTAASDPLVRAFLEFEEATLQADAPDNLNRHSVRELAQEEDPGVSDVPVRRDHSRVIKVSCDLARAIDAVQACTQFDPTNDGQFYVVPQGSGRAKPVSHVSPRMAKAVCACNGYNTVKQVIEHLVAEFPEIPESWRRQFCLGLLGKARSTGLVTIVRTVSAADVSQDGGFRSRE
jgi:hypothetical protein